MTSDIAPIRADHSLFYTDEHHRSFSELSSFELSAAKGTILSFTEAMKVGGSPKVFLEHGPADGSVRSLGCCDHAHIHLVPLGIASGLETEFHAALETEVQKCISANELSPHKTIAFDNLSGVNGNNYIWFSFDLTELRIFFIKRDSRQLLRRIVAGALGESGFETWRLHDQAAAISTQLSLHSTANRLNRGNSF
ncbi:hypothetical protein LB565_20080 [Mesorhizobium sp. CA14]|uniref:hypothetical protein n=1 Tax=Mesorhizobium sp. CA14 TaxID=2876642 RepID=UPI001CCFB65D|nr:hypothetical protein [Mesorhizobium sp. CA14]MBZ9850286.1 hypothetical protein [Mesorhizobium sp. CA14]